MVKEIIFKTNTEISLGLSELDPAVAKLAWQLNRVGQDLSDNRCKKLSFPDRPKILIVEDNPMAQMANYDALTAKQFNVDIAKDYWQALRLYRNHNYALILLDVCLPGKSGLDLCRKIRELEKKSGTHTPIIALTACGEFAEDDSLKAGVDDFAIKPLMHDELVRLVNKWLPKAKTKNLKDKNRRKNEK